MVVASVLVERHDRPRVTGTDPQLDVNGLGDRVERDALADGPRTGLRVGICGLEVWVTQRTALDVDLLVGVSVAPGLPATLRHNEHLDGLEQADRAVLVDQLVRCQVHEPVEFPPHGLFLAPMPAQQLCQEPGRVLFRRALHRIDRDRRRVGKPIDQGLDALLGLAELRDRLDIARPGTRDVASDRRLQLDPECLKPVAQSQVRDDVVTVVALDSVEVRGLRAFPFAQLEPLLEGDDAAAGVAQVDLAREAIERLHLLDGVALDRCPKTLAHCTQKVHEDALAQHVVDLVLARAISTHQSLEGCRLIRCVVIDVEVRVGGPTLGEEVHQTLERVVFGLERELAPLLARPEGVEGAVHLEHAEQVVEAVLEGVGVTLDIEEEVAGRWRRE